MARRSILEPERLTFDDVLILPQLGVVPSRDWIKTNTTVAGFDLGIPIISAPMQTVTENTMAKALSRLGGLGVLHRFRTPYYQKRDVVALIKTNNRPVAVAIGMQDGIERAKIIADECDFEIVVMDVAHAHSKEGLRFVEEIKRTFPDKALIAGSVATAEGAKALFEAGADSLRVGIGPGAACSTRIQTGCGVPQLSAIMECADVALEYGKDIIADGGIRSGGDIVKSLAAGASCVMIGRLFAGAREAPMSGRYFGQASKSSLVSSKYVEGEDGEVELTGPVEDTVNALMAGVRSGISYAGAYDIPTLQERAVFTRVSGASALESSPRISRSATP